MNGRAVHFAIPITVVILHSQVAPHKLHLTERMSLFTIIVLGEPVLGGLAEVQDIDLNIYFCVG
jgi:low temperature requirement protein LtrA